MTSPYGTRPGNKPVDNFTDQPMSEDYFEDAVLVYQDEADVLPEEDLED